MPSPSPAASPPPSSPPSIPPSSSSLLAPQSATWSSLFPSGFPIGSEGLPLRFVAPSSVGSSKVALCPADLLADEALLWENCLVGNFLGSRPPFPVVKSSLSKQWHAQGSLDTFLLDNGFFIFKFSSPLDKSRALEGGTWLVPPPIRCTETADSIHIGSVLGKPLFFDARTRRKDQLAYARICVEVSAKDFLPTFINVHEGEDFSFEQEVHYKWKPPQCSVCKVFAHDSQHCAPTGKVSAEAAPFVFEIPGNRVAVEETVAENNLRNAIATDDGAALAFGTAAVGTA
ncbi:uncharacterized protein LOC122638659 [Telopea speciosissima]|uniref:uncharacterized protein LOC122638659 n=1 Tax=Telopea speciosissima TaxID=54955 RepID=UPI001CC5F5F1|nr:uncharacterized protein LOC122638659 [Telopea speciosissima]